MKVSRQDFILALFAHYKCASELLSIVDLRIRWKYTKGGVYKLVKSNNFPKPFMTVSDGKVKLYTEEAIQVYESDKPWLFDEALKQRRQQLFGLLNQARENPEQREAILKHVFGEGAKNWISN